MFAAVSGRWQPAYVSQLVIIDVCSVHLGICHISAKIYRFQAVLGVQALQYLLTHLDGYTPESRALIRSTLALGGALRPTTPVGCTWTTAAISSHWRRGWQHWRRSRCQQVSAASSQLRCQSRQSPASFILRWTGAVCGACNIGRTRLGGPDLSVRQLHGNSESTKKGNQYQG